MFVQWKVTTVHLSKKKHLDVCISCKLTTDVKTKCAQHHITFVTCTENHWYMHQYQYPMTILWCVCVCSSMGRLRCFNTRSLTHRPPGLCGWVSWWDWRRLKVSMFHSFTLVCFYVLYVCLGEEKQEPSGLAAGYWPGFHKRFGLSSAVFCFRVGCRDSKDIYNNLVSLKASKPLVIQRQRFFYRYWRPLQREMPSPASALGSTCFSALPSCDTMPRTLAGLAFRKGLSCLGI